MHLHIKVWDSIFIATVLGIVSLFLHRVRVQLHIGDDMESNTTQTKSTAVQEFRGLIDILSTFFSLFHIRWETLNSKEAELGYLYHIIPEKSDIQNPFPMDCVTVQ